MPPLPFTGNDGRKRLLPKCGALPRRTARQKAHTGRGICRPAGLLQGMRCPERRDLYAVPTYIICQSYSIFRSLLPTHIRSPRTQTVLFSAKFSDHISDGLVCAPQSSGIYSGQYDPLLHCNYIPGLKFLLFFQFLLVISADMLYNVLVDFVFAQLHYTTKKAASFLFLDAAFSFFTAPSYALQPDGRTSPCAHHFVQFSSADHALSPTSHLSTVLASAQLTSPSPLRSISWRFSPESSPTE